MKCKVHHSVLFSILCAYHRSSYSPKHFECKDHQSTSKSLPEDDRANITR